MDVQRQVFASPVPPFVAQARQAGGAAPDDDGTEVTLPLPIIGNVTIIRSCKQGTRP